MKQNEQKKILGEERRQLILQWLFAANKPLSGSELSKKTNVSRQVIVQDISLLKARNEPIIATAQGYLYLKPHAKQQALERVIVCQHKPEEVRQELTMLVDHGVTIKDVKVEHPVYGDLTASIMVSNRFDVEQYLQKIQETNASYLSQLTDGIHLHTIEADSKEKLDAACDALNRAGFLVYS
ncbi:transcription repressor NadR [Bacillus cytotoxicus]|uniref:transcription repressor NadR n=1 Tax=Bacillus cytotoxicus TaxID=580165 RepID=UPI000864051E|nr:transcription repressor NadR [Bacillus cytotoxicus]AWC29973.1 transcription repressor NadR [Bacillus cytotoxicus]AWC42109.1 transcription repressor NadR [Bacillus cytotoxicus]AWC50040.1 transcription repressor NadR [Bacillus cytotoxicus]AWC54097.1 transcription repressor NadR [Bacillus cytotoxicus]AWC58222.1 transcription repressor NadR [Bacillus cytotoxicus]